MHKIELQKELKMSIEDREQLEFAQWIYDSHFWEMPYINYWKCKWCGAGWTSVMPLTKEYNNLCLENPAIKKRIYTLYDIESKEHETNTTKNLR